MSGVRDVSARKMFGEFALYSQGKVVALVVGTLSNGSADCRGRDRYVALPTLRAWIKGP